MKKVSTFQERGVVNCILYCSRPNSIILGVSIRGVAPESVWSMSVKVDSLYMHALILAKIHGAEKVIHDTKVVHIEGWFHKNILIFIIINYFAQVLLILLMGMKS